MLYAKVVLDLPIEGPLDYIVPLEFRGKLNPGSRVWVTLRNKRLIGYVVKLTQKSNIKNLKKILAPLEANPLLDKNMLALTKELSQYYCSSWGQAIATALPEALRKGNKIPEISSSFALVDRTVQPLQASQRSCRGDFNLVPEETFPGAKLLVSGGRTETILVHSLEISQRWEVYFAKIRETFSQLKSVLILAADKNAVLEVKDLITSRLKIIPIILYRKEPKELEEWMRIKSQGPHIIVGTRSAVFAPVKDLGLLIIDEEENPVYKQDQMPHYHARDVGLMRAHREKSIIILGTSSPSLESFYLAKRDRIKYLFIPRKRDYPQIKILDTKSEYRFSKKQKPPILSKYLEDSISSVLASQGKTLLFINRRGFATLAACSNCRASLKCPRCDINLVYHFKSNILSCHYCNFRMELVKICPHCNAGYIKFSGTGTERIESEISRIFAQAKVKLLDDKLGPESSDADIFVATSSVIRRTPRDYSLEDRDKWLNFDLIGILGIDNSLNRIDLRSSEKTFSLLVGLLGLTDKKLVIQTGLSGHHCFQALLRNDPAIFYNQELKQRRQLDFPPFSHLALIKLRGKKEEKVKEAGFSLFEKLKARHNKAINVLSLNPGHPAKLRGNFYWQILLSAKKAEKISAFLKINLKDFSSSGIIVTPDVDPL